MLLGKKDFSFKRVSRYHAVEKEYVTVESFSYSF